MYTYNIYIYYTDFLLVLGHNPKTTEAPDCHWEKWALGNPGRKKTPVEGFRLRIPPSAKGLLLVSIKVKMVPDHRKGAQERMILSRNKQRMIWELYRRRYGNYDWKIFNGFLMVLDCTSRHGSKFRLNRMSTRGWLLFRWPAWLGSPHFCRWILYLDGLNPDSFCIKPRCSFKEGPDSH